MKYSLAGQRSTLESATLSDTTFVVRSSEPLPGTMTSSPSTPEVASSTDDSDSGETQEPVFTFRLPTVPSVGEHFKGIATFMDHVQVDEI